MLLIAEELKGKSGDVPSCLSDKLVLTKLVQQFRCDRTGSSMLMQLMMQFLWLCRCGKMSAWLLFCLPKWLCRPHQSEEGIEAERA